MAIKCLEDLKDLKLYNSSTRLHLPVEKEDIKHNSCVFLWTPDLDSSKHVMFRNDTLVNMNTFKSYYTEKNARVYFDENGKIYSIEQDVINEGKLKASERKDFGIPELRKYPMPDKAHVLQAIRFFNSVEPKYEEELAKNIIKKINQYDMKDVEVSKKNKFYKYYHQTPLNEDKSYDINKIIKKDIMKRPVPRNRRIYHGSTRKGLTVINPRESRSYNKLGPIVFGSEQESFAATFIISWNDDTIRQGLELKKDKGERVNSNYKNISLWLIDRRALDQNTGSLYELKNDGNWYYLHHNEGYELVRFTPAKVINETTFGDSKEMINKYDIHVFDYNTKKEIEYEPLYFYHLAPKGIDMSVGLITPWYAYHNHQYKLFDKMTEKYRHRICNQWGIYPDKNPDELTSEEVYNAIEEFRGPNGTKTIYFFRYAPYRELGERMEEFIDTHDIYRINLNDIDVRKYLDLDTIVDVHNTMPKNKFDRHYYEKVTEEEYFKDYDDKSPMNFGTLDHIGIIAKKGYISTYLITKITE